MYTLEEDDRNGFILSFNGEVPGDLVVECNKELIEHPSYEARTYQIWDFSKVNLLDLSNSQIKTLAMQDSYAAKRNPNMLVALVGSRNTLHGTDRLYGMYAEVWNSFTHNTFPTMEEAYNWIDSELTEAS